MPAAAAPESAAAVLTPRAVAQLPAASRTLVAFELNLGGDQNDFKYFIFYILPINSNSSNITKSWNG